jgi:basic membrane protein A
MEKEIETGGGFMVKVKKAVFLRAALVLAALVSGAAAAGCGAESGARSGAQSGASGYKVGLLLPGPINDGGWNASASEGLNEIKKNYPNVTVSYQESIPPSNYEEIFRAYAAQGYSLVYGHGYEFGDAAVKAAKEFPNVKFCVTSTELTAAPNLCSMRNNYQEMGYLMGIVAGAMTKTNVIGAVGGMEIPSIRDSIIAFEAAAMSVNPGVKVVSVFTGSFEDVAKAKEAALAMIEQGADILFHNADQSGFGVFEACGEKGVPALGAIGDQGNIAPDTILTSGICAVSKGMLAIFDLLVRGKWEPNSYVMGAAQNAVDVAPFRNFDSQVPRELKDLLAKTLGDMKSGAFDAINFTENAKALR